MSREEGSRRFIWIISLTYNTAPSVDLSWIWIFVIEKSWSCILYKSAAQRFTTAKDSYRLKASIRGVISDRLVLRKQLFFGKKRHKLFEISEKIGWSKDSQHAGVERLGETPTRFISFESVLPSECSTRFDLWVRLKVHVLSSFKQSWRLLLVERALE